MTRTSVSLLDRLKLAGPDASDWNRLQGIYQPLIRRWLGRVPGLDAEADDLAQEVFIVVIRELPSFERRREGSFRAWLRQVTVNKVRTARRRRHRRAVAGLDPADGFLDSLADPNGELAASGTWTTTAMCFRSCSRSCSRTSAQPRGKRFDGLPWRDSRRHKSARK